MNTPVPAQSIPNHLAWAIVSTILATCFCCPGGPAGHRGDRLRHAGQFQAQRRRHRGRARASENAKIWCWVATALAIVGVLWSAWWFTTGGMAAFMEQMQMMQNMQ